jgi:hypothetical protein
MGLKEKLAKLKKKDKSKDKLSKEDKKILKKNKKAHKELKKAKKPEAVIVVQKESPKQIAWQNLVLHALEDLTTKVNMIVDELGIKPKDEPAPLQTPNKEQQPAKKKPTKKKPAPTTNEPNKEITTTERTDTVGIGATAAELSA